CAGGELVTLPAAGGDPVRRLTLERDLRDVVIDADRLLVSRFRAAELLVVESDGRVSGRLTPTGVAPEADAGVDAGGFGAFLRPQMAARCRLFPPAAAGTFRSSCRPNARRRPPSRHKSWRLPSTRPGACSFRRASRRSSSAIAS